MGETFYEKCISELNVRERYNPWIWLHYSRLRLGRCNCTFEFVHRIGPQWIPGGVYVAEIDDRHCIEAAITTALCLKKFEYGQCCNKDVRRYIFSLIIRSINDREWLCSRIASEYVATRKELEEREITRQREEVRAEKLHIDIDKKYRSHQQQQQRQQQKQIRQKMKIKQRR